MNDNIWLVVWDLDRTFFDSGIAGGDTAACEKYAEIIKTLISRGIMNSCCSRGSFQTARSRLEDLGVWDCLIFPCINANAVSKAERVEQIIQNTRLRPQYTLYLDNSAFNRKLAEDTLPKLNAARPSDIFTIIQQPEMKGFTDKLHVRLAQYKLAKPLTEGKSLSDFSVMAQAVMECSLVSGSTYISEIQRIFAESAVLNYTGKRLSPDELNALFNEPDIKHGCVTLKDVWEDHGVVGFYAIRANKLLHFAFSADLLDVPGVEQWTYAKLGYPALTKSKFCMGEVDNSPAPNWINQSFEGADKLDIFKSDVKQRLLVRGSAELAGITRYLKKYVCVTSEIFDAPVSIRYAVKSQQYTEEEKKTVLRAAPCLDPGIFTTAMFSGECDYILISVISERSMIKYSDKTNSALSVYLPREHVSKLDTAFFDQFQSYVYGDDELDDSLQYICDNLPKQTSLIIMTSPEVAFTRVSAADGSDPDRFGVDYQRRLRYNAIAEEVVVRNTNAYLLDIRGLVKSEADLTDFHVLHYGPRVDYELSRVLMALLGVRLPDVNRQASAPPLIKAKLIPDTDIKLSYRAFIVNGLFVVQVEQPEHTGVLFSFSVMMGSQVIDQAGFSADSMCETHISVFGVYWARVGVKYNNEKYYFDTSYFVYNEKTVFNYIDKTAPNFANIHRGHLLPLYDAADNIKRLSGDFSAEVLALLSHGCRVFDYFELRGIEEISILADAKTAPLIMDAVGIAKIRVKHLFTLDMPFSLGASMGLRQYRFNAYNAETIHLGDDDVLLAACVPGKREMADITKLVPGKVKIIWFHTLLHSLSTEHFFAAGVKDAVARGGGGPIIALRLPTIRALKSPSPDDRALLSYSTAKLLTEAGQNISSLPGVFSGVSFEKLSQTAILPPAMLDAEEVWRFSGRGGMYMNIENGLRRTIGQLEKYAGTVYIFGGSMVFGKLVSDDETIASALQASINLPLRVENHANFDGRMQAGRMLSLVNSIDFQPNDVVVIAMEEDQTASTIIPFQFKYIDNSIIKADALSVLNGASGAYYLNNVYSPRGNALVANLLREKIYGLVKLF
ncbi:MAG: hypothetical protein LBB94_00150 [Clostridiales bacterium]|jgi:hypothetical protein|nr:hypothetical protein [Clostridiales bacterium]